MSSSHHVSKALLYPLGKYCLTFFMFWLLEKMKTFVQHTEKIRIIASPEAGLCGSAALGPTQPLYGLRGSISAPLLKFKFQSSPLREHPVLFEQPCHII